MGDWRKTILQRHGFKSKRFDNVYIDGNGEITGDNPDYDMYCYTDPGILSDCIAAYESKKDEDYAKLVQEYGALYFITPYQDEDCTIPAYTEPLNTIPIIRQKVSQLYAAYHNVLISMGKMFLYRHLVSITCCTDSRYGCFYQVDDWLSAAYFELFQLAALGCFDYERPKIKAICKACGKEFLKTAKQTRYCPECSGAAARKRRYRAKEAIKHEAGEQ